MDQGLRCRLQPSDPCHPHETLSEKINGMYIEKWIHEISIGEASNASTSCH
jgi:hypothetical protein